MFILERALVFAYSNARTKAMKGLLLSSSKIREMVQVKTLTEVIAILEQTPYKSDMIVSSQRLHGADAIDHALSRNLAKTCSKVLSFSPKQSTEMIERILKKWDVHNIKTIIAGKHAGSSPSEIESFIVPVSRESSWLSKKLIEQPDVDGILRFLSLTPYACPLSEAMDDYKKSRNIAQLLTGFDKFYYTELASSANFTGEQRLAYLIKTEINIKNIMTILRTKENKLAEKDIMGLVIGGGTLHTEFLSSIARAESVKDVVDKLKSYFDLSEPLKKYSEDRSLVHFETVLEKLLVQKGVMTLRVACLSTAALISFLYLKEIEINNIRKIVRAKEYDLPPEKISEMVFALGD